MNLTNLTNKEIAALRRIGWAFCDFIQEIVYDSDINAMFRDDSEAKKAYFEAIDLCQKCSRELERRGVEE